MSIEVQNVSKVYGEQNALDNISISVKPGEIVGFLGPNGAGKSTMMKIITCFIPQTAGKISVCGFDVEQDPLEVKKRVGYLPEHNPLYLDMYVKEYLTFVAGLHLVPDKKKRVDEMVKLVGLELEQNKQIGELSKGYRQRVGLAQALIHDPDVLILDEPTTGLDPNQIEEIRNLIKKLGEEKTVMMSTHIMQEVEAICDRVVIISQGKIVANDTSRNISESQEEQHVTRVEFDQSVEEDLLRKVSGVLEIRSMGGNEWMIVSKADIRNDLFQFSVKNNLGILTLQKEEKSLEEAFKSLTKN
ncbi:MAG: gliding motility-associated ABC transporter ATP-binding subunit GldA [Crocinitomicaceae bacterium]|nr:gliding motility-associated ABC transporter ATP-binding subunit GldA [Crocinitomicaceae bacterium]|tara:strand:+ start:1786 stop:2688 length:903 start_codon:yes stop_codon:yes gene_type:complete